MLNTRGRGRRSPLWQQSVMGGAEQLHQREHPFVRADDNARLFAYEQQVKGAFAAIEPCLREISALRYDADFAQRAQRLAQERLGFRLPDGLLSDAWIRPLDVPRLFAWCTFETFRQMSEHFYTEEPLAGDEGAFQQFIESCGFHLIDLTPCADGRLAHVVRYVLRLPYKPVRRRSYAGAMFDIEDSLEKWVETELMRYREARPNAADAPTRYLKVAVYHFSSISPHDEGCAAHGSDDAQAAEGAWERLQAFRTGVENTHCCGASIDLLLVGMDTDTDAIRVHLPDSEGWIDTSQAVEASALYEASRQVSASDPASWIAQQLQAWMAQRGRTPSSEGMIRFAARLLLGNLSQIDYVRRYHNGAYADAGHQEAFIGMGIGFEEIQLRNLTYFAYLKTVEEGAADLDVGIRIFSGLNVARGLPVPVVIRNDYHGRVPGARERAVARCQQLDKALRQRFASLSESGMLHTLLMVRDCGANSVAEPVVCSALPRGPEKH